MSEQVPRYVVVSNVFGDLNRGGAAITERTIAAAKVAFPDTPVAAITIDGALEPQRTHGFTAADHPDVEYLDPVIPHFTGRWRRIRSGALLLRHLLIRPSPRWRSAHRVANARVVISKGGFVWVDRTPRGVLSFISTSMPIALAIRYRRPAVVFPTTIGPFNSRLARIANRAILTRARLVIARDHRSYREAIDLGVPPQRLLQMPDVAFGVYPSEEVPVDLVPQLAVSGPFGVVVVRRIGSPDFLSRLSQLIRAVESASSVQQIFAVIQADDREPTEQVVASLDGLNVSVVDAPLSPSQLASLYGRAAFVVTCRLHAGILAFVGGTPAFVISSDGSKTEGILEDLHLSDLVVRQDFLPQAVADRVVQALDNADELREKVMAAVAKARSELEELPVVLKEAVGE